MFSNYLEKKYINPKETSINTNYYFDKLLGSLYGVCIGDALGLRYEFSEHNASLSQVRHDMENNILPIIGGGPFNLKTGQVSDDSEMTLSLLRSIAETGYYDQADVALKYIEWYNSQPVDIGTTISKSLFAQKPSFNYRDMMNNSKALNGNSLSNGVLMRITPIALYSLKIKDKELKMIVLKECNLTHPNPIVKDSAYIYCLAIKYILLGVDKNMLYKKMMEQVSEPIVRIILTDSLKFPEPTYLVKDSGVETYIYADDSKYLGYFGIAFQNVFFELFNNNNCLYPFHFLFVEIFKFFFLSIFFFEHIFFEYFWNG